MKLYIKKFTKINTDKQSKNNDGYKILHSVPGYLIQLEKNTREWLDRN